MCKNKWAFRAKGDASLGLLKSKKVSYKGFLKRNYYEDKQEMSVPPGRDWGADFWCMRKASQ